MTTVDVDLTAAVDSSQSSSVLDLVDDVTELSNDDVVVLDSASSPSHVSILSDDDVVDLTHVPQPPSSYHSRQHGKHVGNVQ